MTFAVLRRFVSKKPRLSVNVLRMFTEHCTEEIFEERPSHTPVMVNEVIRYLDLKEGNVFLDMTFGAGGHSRALLEKVPGLKVIALDRDPVSQTLATELKELYPDQVLPLEGKFSDLPELLKDTPYKKNSIDGVLFDLGCSSMQFDYGERGFSVNKDGPLDMRMDGNRVPEQLTAADVIAHASEQDLYSIFKVYGEEKRSTRIARALIQFRNNYPPMKTTKELVNLIESVCGGEYRRDKLGRKTNVATKVFQALRIFINNEINELNYGLILAHTYLKVLGKAVVISFHSLEDKIVKRHFKNEYVDNFSRPLPLIYFNAAKNFSAQEIEAFNKKHWQPINRNVVLPSKEEIDMNVRSRSAKLRAAIKISDDQISHTPNDCLTQFKQKDMNATL